MNFKLAVVFVAVSILGIASAKPAESEGFLERIFNNFQRDRRQDTPAPAVVPQEAGSNVKPAAEAGAGGNEGKEPEPSIFARRQQQISDGVNTIVKGASGGSLEQILRGSFDIPSNSRVREQARGILDSIFGNGAKN